VLFALAACAVVAALFLRGPLGGLAAHAAAPLYEARRWSAGMLGDIPAYLKGQRELLARVDALEANVQEAEMRNTDAASLLGENESLRALLGDAGGSGERIAAGVLARPPSVPYDQVVIDRGSKDGIKEGAAVYGAGDYVIGSVSRAFDESALVTLISTPGASASVYVIGPDIYTTAYGEGNGIVRVSVPQGVPVAPGDVVVLPGLSRGILGTVDTVAGTPTEPEQRAFIPLASLQSLRYVAVAARVPAPVTFEEAAANVEDDRAAFLNVPVPEDLLETASSTATSTDTQAPPAEPQ
jgi:cell shape-determining protein MreC